MLIDHNRDRQIISVFEQQVFPLSPFLQKAIVVAFYQTCALGIRQVCTLLSRMANQWQIGSHYRANTCISYREVEIDIHIVWETIALIEKSRFPEQLARKCHACCAYGLHFCRGTLFKVSQVVGKQTMQARYAVVPLDSERRSGVKTSPFSSILASSNRIYLPVLCFKPILRASASPA